MGDGLKLSKDKRHRSSSSLAGVALEGTRSERKLDQNESIPELDDHFAIAEGRCDDLQEKINLIKSLKRKKKLKKRSMTRIAEPPKTPENAPFITVRTQPKKKVSQQTARLRRLEIPPNPTRGYLDPATVEQHRMIGQLFQQSADQRPYLKLKKQRSHADGDSLCSQQSRLPGEGVESVACGQDDVSEEFYNPLPDYKLVGSGKKSAEKQSTKRRRHVPRDVPVKEASLEERPVVELFSKSRIVAGTLRRQSIAGQLTAPMIPTPMYPVPLERKVKKVRNTHKFDNECIDPFESRPLSMEPKNVLNGLKIQQPLSGIPLTIAHHMGLGHVPIYGAKTVSNQQPSLDHHCEMNAIRVGQRLVKLPSYKCISYNRLLNLYREGDGMVPRFLRAINRPQYFYTSMYNLAMNREETDGATSKGRGGSQAAKQSLSEYASLYREYEYIDKCIREGNAEPELARRKDELTRELATREEHIRKVVHEYRSGDAEQTLRASASTAEDGYRQSFKFGEAQQ